MKKVAVKELILFLIILMFNGIIDFSSNYFSRESQILSSQLEKHMISRLYFETVNNLPNFLSNIQIIGNLILAIIMISIIIKFIQKEEQKNEKINS